MSHDRREAGFKRRTRVADALATLLDAAEPHGRTESAPLADAGRTGRRRADRRAGAGPEL